MLKPYIIEKIVDTNTGEITYEGKRQESEQIVKESTVEKMKELMYNVINNRNPGTTGTGFRVDGLDVIGKTGTAEIYENGTYLDKYIYSFAGIYPKDDPQLIIYGAVKKPTWGKSAALYTATREVMKNMAKYYNINGEKSEVETLNEYTVENYINKNASDVTNDLKNKNINVILLGTGDKIINQYPQEKEKVIENEKVILLTNSNEIAMPSISGWSKKEVEALSKLLNINYEMNGYGYVINQSIKKGEIITNDIILTVELKDKFISKNQDTQNDSES